MPNRFEYTDEHGRRLRIEPVDLETPDEAPGLWFTTTDGWFNEVPVRVPLTMLEEAIAGQRDMARQAGGQPAPLRRRLTEPEHDRAWHAIEGTAAEEGVDPDTVLNAVLAALGIDPPFDLRPGAPITPELQAYAAAVLPPGARIAAEALRQATQSTQDDFGLATGGPGPTATEGAGA